MKNILYSACWADPWIEIAKKLENNNNLNPVCWVGYEADNSEYLFKKHFKNAYYQRYFEAWRGEFPQELEADIQNHLSDYTLDIDFIRSIASNELQAIQMMDRMDPDRRSFSFSERQRHFRLLLRKWDYLLDKLKVDVVISATVPHRVYDYVIYLLCQKKGIPFYAFRETAFIGRVILVNNIHSISEEICINEQRESTNIEDLPPDIRASLEKIRSSNYNAAEPSYMKKHKIVNKEELSLKGNLNKVINKLKVSNRPLIGKNNIFSHGFSSYHKQMGHEIENSRNLLVTHTIRKMQAVRYKNTLQEYYESICETLDTNEPYVFFALHYQPEMTSNPAGDIFADQKLCIDTLIKHLPKDYKIYIKEHKSQFYAHTEGHTARIKSFYDDLRKYEQVKFVSLNENVFKLIEHSIAVSTVTGTIGWEAMVKQKPVIIFGMAWYENYPGVLKIYDSNDAKKIQPFIQDFHYGDELLNNYLLALTQHSTVGYYFRGIKEKIELSETDCVNNLSTTLIEAINYKR